MRVFLHVTSCPEASVDSDAASLVRRAQSGETSAFADLHAAYRRMVHGIVVARVPLSEVDDLVQEAFLHAWQKIASLRDPNLFAGWLAAIARNLALDFHRRRPRTEELVEKPQGRLADPLAFRVLGELRALPEAYRETLSLRLIEGYTGPEIAALTGLTPDSVRVNLYRGMKLLRGKLEGIR